MATGQNLLGIVSVRPMRVWYWNGEDPQEELERRVLAICLHYDVDRREVETGANEPHEVAAAVGSTLDKAFSPSQAKQRFLQGAIS